MFGKKELLTTMSLEKKVQLQEALDQNGIWYDIKINYPNSMRNVGARGPVAPTNYGESMSNTCEYVFRVKKEDYERACRCL